MITKEEYLDIYDVVGAVMEVYNALGYGMAEPIYQEALAKEMELQGMDAEREKPLRLYYKDMLLEKTYYADFFYFTPTTNKITSITKISFLKKQARR